jgi:sterol 3beta-glucosyltransferase
VDLRYAISCEPLNEKEIRLRTNQKTILLSADSVPSREEWVKAIRKVIFKAQNMGDNVKVRSTFDVAITDPRTMYSILQIAIPYSAVLDVERSHAMDFSETIEVKVFDKEEPFSVDSYFFAYFHDLSAALDQIRDAVRMYRASPRAASSEIVLDTTHIRGAVLNPAPINVVDRTQSLPDPLSRFSVGVGGFSLTSLLRPFHDPGSPSRAAESPAHPPHDAEDFTHISKRSSFIPVTCSPSPMSPVSLSESQKTLEVGTRNTTAPASTTADHTYPPPSTPHDLSPSESTSGSYWSVGVPSWLKNPSRKIFSSPVSGVSVSDTARSSPGICEIYHSTPSSHATPQSDLGFSVLETPDVTIDPEVSEKFHNSFAFDERETLLGCTCHVVHVHFAVDC